MRGTESEGESSIVAKKNEWEVRNRNAKKRAKTLRLSLNQFVKSEIFRVIGKKATT